MKFRVCRRILCDAASLTTEEKQQSRERRREVLKRMQGCRRRCRKREIRSYEKVKLTRLWRVMSQNARKWLTHLSSRSHWIKHPRAERQSSRRALISLHKHTDTDAQTYIKYKPRGMKMHRCWCVNTFILSQCRVGKTSGKLTRSVQPSELNWAVCSVGFASATCWTHHDDHTNSYFA